MNLLTGMGSRITTRLKRAWVDYATRNDKAFLNADVPMADKVSHRNFYKFVVDAGNHTGARVLEVGSREVTGPSHCRGRMPLAQYVGFDYYPGDNVDVVGDAHKLSSYFVGQPRFDLVYSAACFEHFAMPWQVAAEIANLVKVGGLVAVETHFAFSAHERPWHFFHYTDMALRVLFSQAIGFECIEAGMSNPLVGRFSSLADGYLRNSEVTGLYCHVEYLGRKVRDVPDFDWRNVNVADVVGATHYPSPSRRKSWAVK
jgi:hypothetical protein